MVQEPESGPQHPRYNLAALFLPGRKAILKGLIILVLLGVLGGVAWKMLRIRQENNAARLSVAAFDSGKYHEAHLWARRALLFNDRNLGALDVMGRLGSLPGQDPVPWLQKALDVDPASFPRYRKLVLALMERGRHDEARAALVRAEERFGAEADFQSLVGTSALARGELRPAVEAFRKASELAPGSGDHRLNLWTAQLNSPDAAEVALAARALMEWETPADLRPQALANLLSIQWGKDRAGAQRTLDAFLACLQSGFDFKLEVLKQIMGNPAEARSVLTQKRLEPLQREAGTSAMRIYAFAGFLNRVGMREEAGVFLEGVPDALRSEPEWVVARAESLILAGEWDALAELCHTGDWGKYGAIRRLVVVHLDEREGASRGELRRNPALELLLRELRGDPRRLTGLADLAHFWGWTALEAALLETAAQNPFLKKDARVKLYQLHRKTGSTMGLYELMKAQAADDPQDMVAENNLTALGLLLGIRPGVQHERAVDFFGKYPRNAAGASVLALSHLYRGEFVRAEELLSALPDQIGNQPSVRLYRAWAYAGLGQVEKSREALSQIDPTALLPEERRIFEKLAAGGKVE